MYIDAKGMHYQKLNELMHHSIDRGEKEIVFNNVNGHRYIGAGLCGELNIKINGVPGNDLAAFMNGPTIIVNSNAQEGVGNTMNKGNLIIHGDVGDITGHSMRGGTIFIRENAGYRVGIHMKAYRNSFPVIVIGGCAGDFLGEYMAGGLIVVLGLNKKEDWSLVGNYCGTGMHGGKMFIRAEYIKEIHLGKQVLVTKLNTSDLRLLKKYLKKYCNYFVINYKKMIKNNFLKLVPSSNRPCKAVYAY